VIAGEVYVTPHAVEQFQARIAPLPSNHALAAIIRELAEHARDPRPCASGRGIVVRTRGGRYAFRAVIGPGINGLKPAVITILRSRP